MYLFYRCLFSVIFVFGFYLYANSQSLKINEIMSANTTVVYDEDGDTPDWLEIINSGSTEINLSDYYLSESKSNLLKWQFPEVKLQPKQTLLVYASGKDRLQAPLNWYTIIDIGQSWKYFVPSVEPAASWKSFSFNEPGWQNGASGFGFGDNDDNTVIPTGKMSVFIRKKFTITDLNNIKSLWLHIDYDDGFVAYINGTEVCRSGLGAAGSAVKFDLAATSHEAKMYNGGSPEGFNISDFMHLLTEKENVLAIQVHNASTGSSDLSAIPFLSVGYVKQVQLDAPVSKYIQMPALYPHTNFKLSSSGETLRLTFKDGTVADSINYGIIPANYSFGRDIKNIAKWGYFATPTPGLINESPISSDIVKSELKFSVTEMFLKSSTSLIISGANSPGSFPPFPSSMSQMLSAIILQRASPFSICITFIKAKFFTYWL